MRSIRPHFVEQRVLMGFLWLSTSQLRSRLISSIFIVLASRPMDRALRKQERHPPLPTDSCQLTCAKIVVNFQSQTTLLEAHHQAYLFGEEFQDWMNRSDISDI